MAGEAVLVDNAAFARLHEESPDRQPYEMGGYVYLTRKETRGWVTYRTFQSWDAVPIKIGVTADPAAGAEIATITVPAGKRWKFYLLSASLVSSADVANRYPLMTVALAGTGPTYYARSTVAQTASLTIPWVWGPINTYGSTTPAAISGYGMGVGMGISDGIVLPAGTTMAFTTTGIQAADNWGIARYVYKEIDV